MPWMQFNPNPQKKQVGDCAVRAVSKATGESWDDAYSGISLQGLMMHDMPTANNVWGTYLKTKGFTRHMIPDTCPDCYSLKDFCRDHPVGLFVVALNNHVVTVDNGDYFDSWDSGQETPLYYFSMEDR